VLRSEVNNSIRYSVYVSDNNAVIVAIAAFIDVVLIDISYNSDIVRLRSWQAEVCSSLHHMYVNSNFHHNTDNKIFCYVENLIFWKLVWKKINPKKINFENIHVKSKVANF